MTATGVYEFNAMASPCEVRVDGGRSDLTACLGRIAEAEARRIEAKYSRYRDDSVIASINRSAGEPVTVDEETAALLDYADSCYRLSRGLFDVTSGVLRKVWRFDGSDNVPSRREVRAILSLVGWSKVTWRNPCVTLPPGMEIDFGGIGKEYAVDSAILAITKHSDAPVLVNFGGDLRATGPCRGGRPWQVAVESVDGSGASGCRIELQRGAVTTSGDARRFLLKDGVRYSHILDPRNGWPVTGAPRSVTVAGSSCLEAGIMSTLAMLQGRRAETFLRRERVPCWVIR